eukprot:9127-Rhodomonas_salina.1
MTKARKEFLERLAETKVILILTAMEFESRRWGVFDKDVVEPMNDTEREAYVGTVCKAPPFCVGTQAWEIFIELVEDEAVEIDFQPHSNKYAVTLPDERLLKGFNGGGLTAKELGNGSSLTANGRP